MPPLPIGRTIRYGPKCSPGPKRNGRSAGIPVAVGENDRVMPSDDHIAAKSVSCVRVSSGSPGLMRSAEVRRDSSSEAQDLPENRDLSRVVGIVLDDAVQELVVADSGPERPVARIVGGSPHLLVRHALHRLLEIAVRGIERVERGLPSCGRRIADVWIVTFGWLPRRLSLRALRDLIAPASGMEHQLPDRMRPVRRPPRGLLGRDAFEVLPERRAVPGVAVTGALELIDQ